MNDDKQKTYATFAGGCFWCTEAVFKRLKGVLSVEPGYVGGDTENPSYETVLMGKSGHAEAIQIEFDPTIIPYEKLLDVFFATHNPTTKNQQGNDIGPQYRSAIFYHTPEQKEKAEQAIQTLEKEQRFNKPIVTEVTPFTNFYKAEEHHKNYYDKNQEYPYCEFIISPKIKKLLHEFGNDVKEEYK